MIASKQKFQPRPKTWTYENPYPSGTQERYTWDYTGPYQVVYRKWHKKDGVKQYIVSVKVCAKS
jgi:hypothetical protein